jgi:hypothetical protein
MSWVFKSYINKVLHHIEDILDMIELGKEPKMNKKK